MRTVTVLVDAREKRPLPLPANLRILDPSCDPCRPRVLMARIVTRRVTLPVGDYALDGAPGTCYAADEGLSSTVIVERKASLNEIALNCLDPMRRRRFVAALQRHRSSCAHPYLIVEGGLEVMSADDARLHPAAAVDALLRLSVEYGVPIVPLPASTPAQRHRAAEWVARLLIAGMVARQCPLQS